MTSFSLVDLLSRRAQATPQSPAFTFLGDGDTEEESLTFDELDRGARRLALALREQGASGERVLLCYPPGLSYIVGFFGCMYAGATAVPAYPPDPARPERTLPRLRAILEDSQARFALTRSALAPAVKELVAQHGDTRAALVLASDDLPERDVDAWEPPSLGADDLAFLMYTSGSTGSPKGVMLTHGSAIHNVTAFRGFAERPCRTFVSWLPLFHDLGLVVATLYPVYQGAHCVSMSPLAFLQRPLRWLSAISRYRATTTAGPNFAYELCARKIRPEERERLDLSSLSFALSGAEPVRAHTLQRFTEAFAPCGFRAEAFYPAYGLSDATADASGSTRFQAPLLLTVDRRALSRRTVLFASGEGPDTVTLVGCGESIPGQRLIVVDPDTRRRLDDDRIGEIWLSGPSVARGYWNKPEATTRSFEARLAEEERDARPYFRSGDLGFWHEGEIFVVGRLDDMFILHGANHFPEDIEPVIERCHPALRPGCGAAFTAPVREANTVDNVDNTGDVDIEERLVVVHEVDPERLTDAADVIRAIRRAVAEHHELEVGEIALIGPGDLLKTSSGKVRRRACRERFLAGELLLIARWSLSSEPTEGHTAPPPPPPSQGPQRAAAIEAWLLDYFARRLGLPREAMDRNQPFAAFGLPSVEAVRMVGDLGDWLGASLPPTLAWDHPSIERLARHLSGERAATAEPGVPEGRSNHLSEPIAIIGMGCRFPGARSPDELWDLLLAGRDAIEEVPKDRWDVDALYDPDPAAPGKMASRWGGFLRDMDRFDARFFEITPREAQHVDPRQRILLEVAWEALEDAGLPKQRLSGSNTGVFVASLTNDWARLLEADPTRLDAYSGPGTATSALASRLSYFLDLRGPSLTIDTACSGALVAIHLACQSLRLGESEMALVGGVNLVLLPGGGIFFSKAGMLAPDGRCKSFDHRANGLVRSDGAAILVLMPQSAAIEGGHRIHAVIRGSAVNQDGRSDGIMAPNGAAQEAVLRQAYRSAGISPARVQYIEAHGVGTTLGDSIEARALGQVLGEGRGAGRRWLLGSIKTNIGHTEAAAGAAGVIKAALALTHRRIPRNLHFERPNPLIPLAEMQAVVPERLEPFPNENDPLIAGVSSFGLGGTNAHVVLEEAPGSSTPAHDPPHESEWARPYLLPLSARTDVALRELAASWRERLSRDPPPLVDLVFTAQKRRTHFEHRLALIGDAAGDLAAGIEAFLSNHGAESLREGSHIAGFRPRLVFVFSGAGSAGLGTGLSLMREEPVFKAVVEQCDRLFRALLGRGPLKTMEANSLTNRLDRGVIAYPAAFAMEVALAAMWRSYGIEPTAVVGEGLGEVAAAHIAGALRLEDAVAIVAHAGRLLESTEGGGQAHCRPDEKAQAELCAALSDIRPERERVAIISALTAGPIASRALDASYWARVCTLRQPSRIEPAVLRALTGKDTNVFESGLDPDLGGALRKALQDAGKRGAVLTSLCRSGNERRQIRTVMGALYALGHSLIWERIPPRKGRPVPVPTYPWQRHHFWIAPAALPAVSAPSRVLPDTPPPADAGAASAGAVISGAADPEQAAGSIREQLESTPLAERTALLLQHLQRLVGEVVQMPPAALLPDQPLSALGIDSILLAEIRARIESFVGVELPVEHILDGPSPAELCRRVLSTQAPLIAERPSPRAATTAAPRLRR